MKRLVDTHVSNRRLRDTPVVPTAEPLENRMLLSVNVLTYHNDAARTGQNLQETALTPANVKSASFQKLFSYPVDGQIYAEPLYVTALNLPGQGVRNVVFVATEHNSVYAFDADSNAGPNGGLLWHVNLGPSAPVPNNDFGNRYGAYHDITVEVGITSTPVIDLASGTLYADAFTRDGPGQYSHHVHALDITTGQEKLGGPVLVTASVPGTGASSVNGMVSFIAKQELQRSALTLVNGMLYVTYAGYADTDPYHGWIIGFDATTLQPVAASAFNDTPNGSEGGIWMGGGGLASDADGNLFLETGNGSFSAAQNNYGDSFLKLSTTQGLSVSDSFTPFNQAALAQADRDLGSGSTVLLPDQPGTHPHEMIGAGKEGRLYLIDRDNMGHYDPATDHVIQELAGAITGSFDTPAYFNGTIYYSGTGDVTKAFALRNGLLTTSPTSRTAATFPAPGATPSISADGNTNGVLWEIQYGTTAVLRAYDATNLSRELYDSGQAGTRDRLGAGVKFAVPTVANGHVYVGTANALAVFGPKPVSTVVGRFLFYNNSAFDGNEPLATATDDNAIATDKQALLPGQAASFVNYSSYTKGINGVIVDLAGLPQGSTLAAGDLVFRAGNDNSTSTWAIAPAPSSITVRPGAGVNGSTRVELVWPDFQPKTELNASPDNSGAIGGKWLQITVKADSNTALSSDDVFYFGNAPADNGSGNPAGFAAVNATDEIAARNDPHNFTNPAPIDNPQDYDRDSKVDATDQILARNNGTNFLSALKLITAPTAALAAGDPFATASYRGVQSLAGNGIPPNPPKKPFKVEWASGIFQR